MELTLLSLGDVIIVAIVILARIIGSLHKSSLLHELKMHDRITEYNRLKDKSFYKIAKDKAILDNSINTKWLIVWLTYAGIHAFAIFKIGYRILYVLEELIIQIPFGNSIISL